MHTIPQLTKNQYTVYHDYLQSDHDFLVWVEVLSLAENQRGTVELLDGQVNLQSGNDGPNRTASLVLSDPEGALNYGVAYARQSQQHHLSESPHLWPIRVLSCPLNAGTRVYWRITASGPAHTKGA